MSDNIIYQASKSEADEIMQYIDNEWKKGHILAVNKKYFLYEYASGNMLNFIISRKNNKINGILGFMTPSIDVQKDVWLALWKVSKSNGSPMLGIKLLKFLLNLNFRSVICSGVNSDAIKIYNYLGFETAHLNHYYLLNNKIKKFHIAKVSPEIPSKNFVLSLDATKEIMKLRIDNIETYSSFFESNQSIPFKDFTYFKKRFLEHPYYDYEIFGVFFELNLISLMVVRVSHYLGSSCLRIVDFLGDENSLLKLIPYLYNKMIHEGHEYIDFLCYGFDEALICNVGFSKLFYDNENIVIPNYFEPFIQENIKIHYSALIADLRKLRICKADGDQDRLNLLN